MMRLGIIGTAGFASSHHLAVQALESAGECRLVCTCDIQEEALRAARERWDLDRRSVHTYTDYREMLDAHRAELDMVTVPAPIPLHAEMHRACVERGLACYLEKPPTLDPDELERMIALEAQTRRETQVGFNFIAESTRQALKARLLSGEFGRLRQVSFSGWWPRASSYYARNAWAGRLIGDDGRLVLDSCIGNAMAHYLHNLLFWAGTDSLFSWASPAAVTAELYRAHAIQGFDTCFVRAECVEGAELRIAASHACEGPSEHQERLECEEATITYVTGGTYEVTWGDGRPHELAPADRHDLFQANLRAYFSYLRGDAPRPLTRLADARPFVHLQALAYVAAGAITQVGPEHLLRPSSEGDPGASEGIAITGVREACATFMATGRFPSAQGLAWARTSGGAVAASPVDLSRLPGVIRDMAYPGIALQRGSS